MSQGLVISDASPLIALERIDRLDLLHMLFDVVIVPTAVAQEIGPTIAHLPWIDERRLSQQLDSRVAAARLGPGEREALSLALEFGDARIIVDDLPARILADVLVIPIVGTIGVLLAAKRHAYLSIIRSELDALRSTGFRMGPDLYHHTLALAEERD
ncbi:MAG: DUF3368 domain-containing protein [Thermomicrobiales bacterium]